MGGAITLDQDKADQIVTGSTLSDPVDYVVTNGKKVIENVTDTLNKGLAGNLGAFVREHWVIFAGAALALLLLPSRR